MIKKILTLIVFLSALSAAPALAGSYPGDIGNLESFLSGASYTSYSGGFSGLYDVTALGYESKRTNEFVVNGSTLFSTADTSDFGTFATAVDLAQAAFTTTYSLLGLTHTLSYGLDTGSTRIYELTGDWTVPGYGGLTLSAGTLILGFNDNLLNFHGDYDDMIVAVSSTPIPGAVWLLGTGLVGLVGLRRKLRA